LANSHETARVPPRSGAAPGYSSWPPVV
jgi:hypothetical protein